RAGVIADASGAAARSGEAKTVAASAVAELSTSRLEKRCLVMVSSRFQSGIFSAVMPRECGAFSTHRAESEATTTKNSSSVVTALPAYAGDDSWRHTPNSLL